MPESRARWADLLLRANGCVDLLNAAGLLGARRWLLGVSFGVLGTVLLWVTVRRWRWRPEAAHVSILGLGLGLALFVLLMLLAGTAVRT